MHIQNTINRPRFQGRLNINEHILSTTSSTCTLSFWFADSMKWHKKQPRWAHMGIGWSPCATSSRCHVGMIQGNLLEAILSLWIRVCFSSKRLKSRAHGFMGPHVRRTGMTKYNKMENQTLWQVGTPANRPRLAPPVIGASADPPVVANQGRFAPTNFPTFHTC